MTLILSDVEKTCLKKMAELHEKGERLWKRDLGWESIGLTEESFLPVLSGFQGYGFIENVQHTLRTRFVMFAISATAVQTARDIAEQEKKLQEGKDIMEHVKVTLRKHPVAGWVIVVFTTVLIVATAITQIAGALKVLGLIK
jgi:hypothetical protein